MKKDAIDFKIFFPRKKRGRGAARWLVDAQVKFQNQVTRYSHPNQLEPKKVKTINFYERNYQMLCLK